ncbi:MAG: phosphatidylglycerophosphatase A [Acidiferrobacterales bacterium]|nr:phosphatidylglycerophosphatase A [Acidiferrobacterales bacterium]
MKPKTPTRNDLLSSPACFLGLGLGSGLAPVAPGTFGTLAAVPVYIVSFSLSASLFWAITLLSILIGAWVCGSTAARLDSHDHPAIVWDEFAGFFLTMLFVPFTWANVITGFILFRIFDILKPWPIKWVDQKVHGGMGIMLDDLIAGMIAALILWWTQPWLLSIFSY